VPAVEQRISLITLGVSDLSRAKRFYEALGWRGQEVEQTVFFQAGGMALVLWGEDKLAADAGLGVTPRGSGDFRGMSLAQNVRSRAEVDSAIAAARSAGATVTQEPAETFYGGYAGYFADPDGHAWEVAHNPGFTLAEDGSLTLPDFGASG
jgi:predicted lactoylglutathione lyase